MTLEDPIYAGTLGRMKANQAAAIRPGVRYLQMPEGMEKYYGDGFTLSGPAVRISPGITDKPVTRTFDIHGNLISELSNSYNTTVTYDELGRVTSKTVEYTTQYYGETTVTQGKTTLEYDYPSTHPDDDHLYTETYVTYKNGEEIYRSISTPESRRRAREWEEAHPRKGL